MRRRGVLAGALALLLAASLGLAACGGGDDDGDEAAATTDAATAPATTAPATTAPATTAPTESEATQPGTAAAGETVFLAKCDGCHAGGGTRAGYGPKLQGAGLTEPVIRETIINGRLPLMPAGRATGQDLEDVVAYVVSLQ
jgi:mono/diheme cytochrome c family protein